MSVINISVPSKAQALHGLERTVLVFVVFTLGYWIKTPNPLTKAASTGAIIAGLTAAYQAVVSTFTTL